MTSSEMPAYQKGANKKKVAVVLCLDRNQSQSESTSEKCYHKRLITVRTIAKWDRVFFFF